MKSRQADRVAKLEFLKILSAPERVAQPVVAVFDPHRQRDTVYSILRDSFAYEVRREDCIVHPQFLYYLDNARFSNVSINERERPCLFLMLLDIEKVPHKRDQAKQIQDWMDREKITVQERCIALLVHPQSTGKQPLPEQSRSFFSSNPQEKAEKLLAESIEWFAKNNPNLPVEVFHSVKTPSSIEGNLIVGRMAFCEAWQNSADPKRHWNYDAVAYRYLRFGMLGHAQQIYCRPLTAKLYLQVPSLQSNSWDRVCNDDILTRVREELSSSLHTNSNGGAASSKQLENSGSSELEEQQHGKYMFPVVTNGTRPWPPCRASDQLLDVMVHACTCSILVLLRMNNAEGACQLSRPHFELIADALREAKKVSPVLGALFIYRFSAAFLRILRESLLDDDTRFLDYNMHYVETVIFCRNALVRAAVYYGADLPPVLVREAISASCPPPPDLNAEVSEEERRVRAELQKLDPVFETHERIRRELRNLTQTAASVASNGRRYHRMHVQLECQIAELQLYDNPTEAAMRCSALLASLRRERWSYVVSYLSRLQLRCETRCPGCVPREHVVASCLRILALSRSDIERRMVWNVLLVAGRLDAHITLDLDTAVSLSRHPHRRWIRSMSVRNEEEANPLNHPSIRCAVNTAVRITLFVRMPVSGITISEARLWLVCENLSGRFEHLCVLGSVGASSSEKEDGIIGATASSSSASAAGGSRTTTARDVTIHFGCVPEFAGAYYLQQLFVNCEGAAGTARLLKVFPTPKRMRLLAQQAAGGATSSQQQQSSNTADSISSASATPAAGAGPGAGAGTTTTTGFTTTTTRSAAAAFPSAASTTTTTVASAATASSSENYTFVMSCEPEADVEFDVKLAGDAICFADPHAPTPELHIGIRSNDVLSKEPTKIERLVPQHLRTPRHGRTLSTTSLPNVSRVEGARFLELRRRYRANHCQCDDLDDLRLRGQLSFSGFGLSSGSLSIAATSEASITDALDATVGCMSVYADGYGSGASATLRRRQSMLASPGVSPAAAVNFPSNAADGGGGSGDATEETTLPPQLKKQTNDTNIKTRRTRLDDDDNDNSSSSKKKLTTFVFAEHDDVRVVDSDGEDDAGNGEDGTGHQQRRQQHAACDDDTEPNQLSASADDATSLVRVASALHPHHHTPQHHHATVSTTSAVKNSNKNTPPPPPPPPPRLGTDFELNSDREDEGCADEHHSSSIGFTTNINNIISPTKRPTRRSVSYEAVVSLLERSKTVSATPDRIQTALSILCEHNNVTPEQVARKIPRDAVCHVLSPIPQLTMTTAVLSPPTGSSKVSSSPINAFTSSFATMTSPTNNTNSNTNNNPRMAAAAGSNPVVSTGKVEVRVPVPPTLRGGGVARLLWTYVKLGELREMQSTFNIQPLEPFSIRYTMRPFRGRLFCAAVVSNTLAFTPLAITEVEMECLATSTSSFGETSQKNKPLLKVVKTSQVQLPVKIDPCSVHDISFLFELAPRTDDDGVDVPLPDVRHPVRLCLKYTAWSVVADKLMTMSNNNVMRNDDSAAADCLSEIKTDLFEGPIIETEYSKVRPFSALIQHEQISSSVNSSTPGSSATTFAGAGASMMTAAGTSSGGMGGGNDSVVSSCSVHRPVRFFLSIQSRASAPLNPMHRQLRLMLDVDPECWLAVGFTDRILSFNAPNCQVHVQLDLVPLQPGALKVPGIVLMPTAASSSGDPNSKDGSRKVEPVPVDLVVSQTAIVVAPCFNACVY